MRRVFGESLSLNLEEVAASFLNETEALSGLTKSLLAMG